MARASLPHNVDVHVGSRIRLRRKLYGVSQEKLADALGLTFQQVQKYERGRNRVSASKLYETARFLEVPITYFFEGLSGAVPEGGQMDGERSVSGFLGTREGLELAQQFTRITRTVLRRRILDLVRALVDEPE